MVTWHRHQHRFGPVASDGLRHCVRCDLWPGALPPGRLLYAVWTDGQPVAYLALQASTGAVRWMDAWDRWPLVARGRRADWSAAGPCVARRHFWPTAVRRVGPWIATVRGGRPAARLAGAAGSTVPPRSAAAMGGDVPCVA